MIFNNVEYIYIFDLSTALHSLRYRAALWCCNSWGFLADSFRFLHFLDWIWSGSTVKNSTQPFPVLTTHYQFYNSWIYNNYKSSLQKNYKVDQKIWVSFWQNRFRFGEESQPRFFKNSIKPISNLGRLASVDFFRLEIDRADRIPFRIDFLCYP